MTFRTVHCAIIVLVSIVGTFVEFDGEQDKRENKPNGMNDLSASNIVVTAITQGHRCEGQSAPTASASARAPRPIAAIRYWGRTYLVFLL